MFNNKNQVNIDEIPKGTVAKYLTDVKDKFVSRRNALKEAGSMVAGAGLVFLGLGLPGISNQAHASGGPNKNRCIWCSGGCMGCTGCLGGCQGGCKGCDGCDGCTGTSTASCRGGEESCDACDGTCAETCGDACSTSCASEAKGAL